MRKGDIEKSLKRFLKRKVSYSLALLIAFMITGGISLGAEITAEEIQESKGDLLSRIQTEREEIKRKIAENERLIKEYNSNFVELVRKGDFYSKPLFNSTQVFFSYQHLDSGKMKDVTEKEFSETIDAINKHYGTRSGRSILKSTGNIGKDKLMAGNGVAVDTEVFRETIEVGANIKPVEPVLPEINPSVSVNVSAPTITLGGLPSTVAPVVDGGGTITAPSLGAITPPSGVTVSVATPGAVASINVTAPTVPTPTVPGDKTIVKPTVTIPNAVDPTMILAPEAPELPKIDVPTPLPISLSISTTGTGDTCNFFITANNYDAALGAIQQIIVTDGTFNVTSTSGGMKDVSVSGYDGYTTITNSLGAYTAGDGSIPTIFPSSYTVSNLTGFYKWCVAPIVRMGANTIFNYKGDGSGPARALIKNDIHTQTSPVLSKFVNVDASGNFISERTYTAKLGDGTTGARAMMSKAEYEYIKDVIYPKIGTTSTSWKFDTGQVRYGVNHGTWSLSGTKINGYEADGHQSYAGANIFHNNGTITVEKDSHTIAVTGIGKEAGVSGRPIVIANSGKMILNGKKAVFLASVRNESNDEITFINTGTLQMNGGGNAGLLLDGHATGNSTIYLEKPIEIYGDNNIGVYVKSDNFKINSANSEIRVNMGVDQANNTGIAEASSSSASNNSGNSIIDESVGLYSGVSTLTEILKHDFKIGTETAKNIAVYTAGTGTVKLGTGSISIAGGIGNIGLAAVEGNIESAGSISITGGIDNIAVITKNGKNISVKDITISNTTENTLAIVASSGTVNVTGDLNIQGLKVVDALSTNGKNALGVYSESNGNIILNNTTLGTDSNPDIEITGMACSDNTTIFRGIGLMANNGNIALNNPLYIKVTNGAAGVASINTNGNINIAAGSTIEVDNGYAVYSDGTG